MNNDDNDEDTCYILKEYLNYQINNKYIILWGGNMMVGQFYEIWCVINDG